MIKAGVIGYPISHSLSPVIHNYWLQKHNIEGSYEAIEVVPENLEKFIKDLDKNGFAGVNVTIPHKEKVLAAVNKVAKVVKYVGAVNTIVVDDGVIKGTNTDLIGFLNNILAHSEGIDFKNKKAVVVGAGGAAKAIVPALMEQRLDFAEIVIVNRTEDKSLAIKEFHNRISPQDAAKIKVAKWKDRNNVLEETSLIVNTTSLGMVGKDRLDISLDKLPMEAVVTDIVYNPLETNFLKEARLRGNKTIDGLGMLLYQAVDGFNEWFGVKPEVTDELRQKVLENLR